MDIPTKIVVWGDQVRAGSFIGDGHRCMAILENMMAFQGLEQYAIMMSPQPGVMIICKKVFGMRVMEIVVEGGAGTALKEPFRECICIPHFAFGVVMKTTPGGPDPEVPGSTEAYIAFLKSSDRFTYDVDVCTGNSFVLKTEVLSAGWEYHPVGSWVLVTMAGSEYDPEAPDYPLYDCDRKCLMAEPKFKNLMISPMNISGMKKWLK